MCKCHPFQGGASVGLMDSNGGICQYLYNNRGKTRHGSIWHLQALQPGRRMDRTQKLFFFFCWYLGLLGMRFQCFEVSIGAFECILNYDTWRKNIAGDWWYSFYSDLFSLFWICILSHMVMQVEHEPMQLVFEVSILLLCSLEEE